MTFPVGSLAAYLSVKGAAQARRDIQMVQMSLTEAGTAGQRAGAGMGRAEAGMAAAGRSASTASASAGKLRAAQLSLVAATERYNAVLMDENATVRELATAEAALIRANERVKASSPAAPIIATSNAAREAEGRVGGFAGALESAGKMAIGLGATLGAFELAKVAIGFVSAGKDLTSSLNGVQAAARASDDQMKAVRAEALALGHDMTVPAATAVDAADAINDLVRSGMTLPRAMAAARPALLLASAAQVATADSARFLGDTLDDFQLPASQAAHVANVLAGAATSAGGGLSEMFDAIKYAGPFARAAGVSVDELATAVAELAKGGIQGSMAGTGLRMMLQSLAKASPAAQKALQDLGVEAWDSQGRFVGLRSVIGQLHDAQQRFGSDSKTFLKDISTAFGARAATIVASFAHKGVEGYDEFANRVASGDVQRYANLMNRGVSAELTALRKEFTAAGIDVYDKLEPALSGLVGTLAVDLPHAAREAEQMFGPLIHDVAVGLTGAWKGLTAVLGPAEGALEGTTHFLAEHNSLTSGAAGGVLAMWAAWKGYQITKAAAVTVTTALESIASRAAYTKAALGSIAEGNAATSFEAYTARVTAADAQATAMIDADAAVQARAYATEAQAAAEATAAIESDLAEASAAHAAWAAQVAGDAEAVATASQTAAAETAAAAAEIDTAGASASIGWTAALGPLAAIGIGVGLLTALFHKNSDSVQQNRTFMDGYAESLKQSASGLAAINTAQTISNLRKKDDFFLLQQVTDANRGLGISQADLVTSVNEGGAAYASITAKLKAYAAANDTWKFSIDNAGNYKVTDDYNAQGEAAHRLLGDIEALRKSFSAQQKQAMLAAQVQREVQQSEDGGADAAAKQARSIGLGTQAYLDAQQAAKQNTAQTAAQTAAFQAENDAADLLNQALKGLAGINLSQAQAQTALAESNLQVLAAFKQNGTAIRGNTAAAVANQQAIQGQVSAAQQAASAIGQKTHSTIAEIESMRSSRSAIEDELRARGKLTPAVQRYIDQLYSVQKLSDYLLAHPTKLDADPARATSKIKVLQQEIDDIKQGRIPGLTADNAAGKAKIAQLQAAITSLRQGVPPKVGVNTDGALSDIQIIQNAINGLHGTNIAVAVAQTTAGGPGGVHAATGGLITGPGSTTSDSIPAMLSNREFVSTAASADRNGAALAAGNAGATLVAVRGYASGGYVDATRTGGHAGVEAVAEVLKAQAPAMREAMTQLAQAADEAFTLKKTEATIDNVKNKLTTLRQYQSGVVSTLQGQFDPSQYGSVSDLISGMSGASATNGRFTAEIKKLRAEHLRGGLLTELIAKGPNATLDTLASASKAQIAQVNRAQGTYVGSLSAAGSEATLQRYGVTVAGEKQRLGQLERLQVRQAERIDKLIDAISRETHHEVDIKINGETQAKAVFNSRYGVKVIDSITHGHKYRRTVK